MAYPSTITPGRNAMRLFKLNTTNSSSVNYGDEGYCIYRLEVMNTACSQLIKEETTLAPEEEPTP